MRHIVIPILLALLIAAITPLHTALSQTSEQEAQQTFDNAGCSSCHSWQDVTGAIASWAQEYPDIDTAAQSEYGKTFDGLMQDMSGWAGGLSDSDYQLLRQYFIELFQANLPPANETGGGAGNQTNQTNQTGGAESGAGEGAGNQTNTTTCTPPPPQECECNQTPQVVKEKEYYVINESTTRLVELREGEAEPAAAPGTASYVPAIASLLVLASLGYLVLTVARR